MTENTEEKKLPPITLLLDATTLINLAVPIGDELKDPNSGKQYGSYLEAAIKALEENPAIGRIITSNTAMFSATRKIGGKKSILGGTQNPVQLLVAGHVEKAMGDATWVEDNRPLLENPLLKRQILQTHCGAKYLEGINDLAERNQITGTPSERPSDRRHFEKEFSKYKGHHENKHIGKQALFEIAEHFKDTEAPVFMVTSHVLANQEASKLFPNMGRMNALALIKDLLDTGHAEALGLKAGTMFKAVENDLIAQHRAMIALRNASRLPGQQPATLEKESSIINGIKARPCSVNGKEYRFDDTLKLAAPVEKEQEASVPGVEAETTAVNPQIEKFRRWRAAAHKKGGGGPAM